MIKRLTWFITGAAAGAGSVLLVGRRIKRRVAELAPVRVAERAVDRTRESVSRIRRATTEGKLAMREREGELRVRLLGSGSKPSDRSPTIRSK